MWRILYYIFCVFLLAVLNSAIIMADGIELNYLPVSGELTYRANIAVDNIVHSGEAHVSTSITVNSLITNEFSPEGENLFLKVTFEDITLSHYNRELQILNKMTHKVGLNERKDIEVTLKNNVQHKWNNLVINKKGSVLEKYCSFDLGKVDFFDMTRVAEQFFIRLPDKKIEVGQQWKDTNTSIFPPYDQADPFLGIVSYTYLGKEEYEGIPCHKIKATLYLDEERYMNANKGMTKVSWVSLGILYFAVEGNFLVESDYTSDFSLLVKITGDEFNEIHNFVQTGVKYNIKLISRETQ